MESTLYDILGVRPDSDRTIIMQVYTESLRAAATDPSVDVTTLTQAYAVLISDGRRAAYDFALHRAAEERDGYDTTYEVVVSPEEAHRGTMRVLTFHRADGRCDDVTTHIPPGAYDGMAIRHPGKGGPSQDGQHHGDLIIVVRIHSMCDTARAIREP